MKRLVPADGIVQVWGGCSSGLAPGARPLESVATRMGSAALLALTTIIADTGSIQRWARPVRNTVPLEAPTNLASLENGGACHNASELPRAVAVSRSSTRV
jgi:hypothetical protein